MGDSKALPILGGLMLILVLPLVIVLIMLISVMGGLDTAEAQCAQAAEEQDQSLMAWPTDEHKIDLDWDFLHHGYDFRADEDSKVYASNNGKVVKASGHEVRIRLEGVETRYRELKTISVSVGATVERGDTIGTVGSFAEANGNDGNSIGLTGPHLHWEMWADKEQNDKWETTKPEENPFEIQPLDDGGACSCMDGNLTGSNNQQKAFNFFVQNGYTKEQAAGIVGNMIAESGVEPGRLQGTPPGKVTKPSEVLTTELGWGLVQWTPARKMVNPSRDDGIGDEEIGSLAYQLQFLLKQLRGQGPLSEKAAGDAIKAAKSVDEAAYEFGDKFERFYGHENPSSPTYAQRKANARHVLSTFGGSAPSGGADSAGDTTGGGGCGAGSGNIAAVAKGLAWPEQGHDGVEASRAKKEYVAAMEKYNDGSSGEDPYSDCGRFVATVMRMSGADPNYPKVGTDVQRSYLESSGKYEWWHGKPPGGMKPGDILNGPGHTYLYVGPWGQENKGFNAASASLHDHVPEAGYLYDVGSGSGNFTVYRLKSAPESKK